MKEKTDLKKLILPIVGGIVVISLIVLVVVLYQKNVEYQNQITTYQAAEQMYQTAISNYEAVVAEQENSLKEYQNAIAQCEGLLAHQSAQIQELIETITEYQKQLGTGS